MSRLKSRKTQKIEEWRVVSDYPNYEVSSLGRVRRSIYCKSCSGSVPGKVLKRIVHRKTKYNYVCLSKNRICSFIPIHQLVLTTFVGPCPDKYDPNHKNTNKSDNALTNLEWIPILHNRAHKGENNGASVYTQKQAIHARWLCRLNFSCREIAKIVGCSSHLVARIRYKFKWSHA